MYQIPPSRIPTPRKTPLPSLNPQFGCKLHENPGQLVYPKFKSLHLRLSLVCPGNQCLEYVRDYSRLPQYGIVTGGMDTFVTFKE
jgi:hypothetical protein